MSVKLQQITAVEKKRDSQKNWVGVSQIGIAIRFSTSEGLSLLDFGLGT